MESLIASPEKITRRERILRAAKKLFLQNGYENTSVRQIVDEADTSMGNLYYHFPDKLSILKVICQQFVSILREQTREVHNLSLSPEIGFALDFRIGLINTLEDPKLSQLWLVVRKIPEIYKYSLENKRNRLKTFFGDRFLDDELGFLAIAIQGIADSFYAQKGEGYLSENAVMLSKHIIDYSLRLLGHSPSEIDKVIKEVDKYILERHITTSKYFVY